MFWSEGSFQSRPVLILEAAYTYDGVGNLTSVTDPLSRTTAYTYDGRDSLTAVTDPSGATTAYTYDDVGRVLTRTDPTGRVWTYTYEFDRLATETAPDGGVTAYTYDGAGRVDQMTDPLGRATTYGYDGAHRRTTVTSPIDVGATATSTTSYDGNGRVATSTNAETETTAYSYDALGRLVQRTDALSRATVYGYDATGNRTSVTNAEAETTSWVYDLAGQLESVTNAETETTSYTYDLAGNLESVTDPLTRTTTYGYDSVNRRDTTTVPSGDTGSTVFDTAGQVTSSTSPAGVAETYAYDARGLVELITDELGNSQSSAYDQAGRLITATDGRNNDTTFTYDLNGRLESETDPLGGTVEFGYDLAGQRTSLTDPNNAERTWAYDDGGRMTTATDATNRTTSYAYDAVGRRTGMTDARGITIVSTFDDAGQLTDRVSPNETQSFSYDDVGRRTAWSDASGNSTVTHDDVGRMTGITNPAGAVTYGYNAAGEQTTMVQPEGTVTNSYDSNGFMASVSDWRGDTIAMTNDADGRMLTQERSNNVDTNYSYDTAGRLTGIDHANGATIIDEFVYSLDGNGNRTGVTSNSGTESYTLDALNRLTAVSYPGAVTEAFGYDDAGNRTSHTKTDGTTVGYTVDDTGQLISDTAGTTYSYDAAGNLAATSAGDSYTYDDYSRTTSVTAGATTQTYGYDATGARVAFDGVGQLWDRSGLPTLISTSAGDSYVHAAGVARDGDDWLLADAVGSVRATVDNAGATIGTADYSVFGEQLSGAGTFGFAGEQQDPTGQIHLRARQYNPTLGRFTSVDPVQPGAPGTTGWNLYAYSGNNPTTWSDPSGQAVAVGRSLTQRFIAGASAAAVRNLGRVIVGSVLAAAYTGIECALELGPFGGIGEQFPGPCGVGQRLLQDNTIRADQQPTVQAVDTTPTTSTTPLPAGSNETLPDTRDRQCVSVGGYINYLPLRTALWSGGSGRFASGASALLTEDFLMRNAKRTAAAPRPAPPGVGSPYDNAHLVAASLGGSNVDGRNFVSLHQNKNRGRMRVLEREVQAAVRECDVVELNVTPSFDFSNTSQPLKSVHYLAVSETAGVIANETIANTDEFGVRAR